MFNHENYIFGDQNVKVPAHLNFGKYILDKLRQSKQEIALEHGESHEKLTYAELTQYAVSLAVSLKKLGVGLGDTVAVGSEKRNEFVPTILGIIFTGATYTPYDLKSGRAVLRHKLSITKPKYFICSDLFWRTYSDILQTFESIQTFINLDDDVTNYAIPVKSLISEDINVDLFEPAKVQGQTDVAFILYSSGTTGMPKGVQLTHLNCILNSLPDDFKDDSLNTVFLYGEWYHNYDTFMTYKFLSMGRRIVYITDPSPQTFLRCVQDNKVDIAMIIPSLVGFLSKSDELDKFNLGSLKIIYSRSSPLHVKTIDNVKESTTSSVCLRLMEIIKPSTGILSEYLMELVETVYGLPKLQNILQGYGMTESGEPTSESWATKGLKTGSVGMASPGITLKVVDVDTNRILGPNQHGEIRLRGPVFMKGYIGVNPSIYLDEEDFFKTGDLGYYDDDGYFFIVDRIKEIISYDGNKIAPLELEAILQLHPGVQEAGVVGKPVPDYGEEPAAYVVRQPGSEVTEEELIEYVANEVPPYMQLRGGVSFLEELPRNGRGKILRRRLRELLNQLP